MEFKKYLVTSSVALAGSGKFDSEEEADKWMNSLLETYPSASVAKYTLGGVYTSEVVVKEVRKLKQVQ